MLQECDLDDEDEDEEEGDLEEGGAEVDKGINVRSAFVAPPGCSLISADYSQVEIRECGWGWGTRGGAVSCCNYHGASISLCRSRQLALVLQPVIGC